MALIKKIETESGATAEYHNVSIYKDTHGSDLEVYLNSYVSKQARQEGKPPVAKAKRYYIPLKAWKGKPEGVEAAVYAYLKTLPEFEGAEDELTLSGTISTREKAEYEETGEEDV